MILHLPQSFAGKEKGNGGWAVICDEDLKNEKIWSMEEYIYHQSTGRIFDFETTKSIQDLVDEILNPLKVYDRTSVSVVLAVAGLSKRLLSVGAVLAGALPSEI